MWGTAVRHHRGGVAGVVRRLRPVAEIRLIGEGIRVRGRPVGASGRGDSGYERPPARGPFAPRG
jgi:hypothetical protein